MQVYIEDAFLQNLIINYLLLSISNFAIKEKSLWYKLLGVSSFGSFFVIFVSLFQIKTSFLIPIKILCGVIITLLMVKGNNLKKYLLFFFVFLSMTFVMGGGIVALQNLFGKNFNKLFITIIVLVFYIILKNIFRQFYFKKNIDKFYYDIDLIKENNFCKIKAYLDSGNLLVDKETNLPILIVNYSILEKLYCDKITIIDFLQQRLDKKLNGKYIEYKTISGQAKMFVCKLDKVLLSSGKQIDVLLGVGKNLGDKDYQGLLSPLAL